MYWPVPIGYNGYSLLTLLFRNLLRPKSKKTSVDFDLENGLENRRIHSHELNQNYDNDKAEIEKY